MGYPMTLGEPLKEAMRLAQEAGDEYMAKRILELMIYYKKSENFEKMTRFSQMDNVVGL